ncbi:MAG: hypothetical protein ACYC6J_02655 [Coriobacteriia bacterium]
MSAGVQFLGKFKTLLRRTIGHFDESDRLLRSLEQLAREQLNTQRDQHAIADRRQRFEIQHFLMAVEAWRHDELERPRYADPRHLNRFEWNTYSQDGSDGILAEVFRRIGEGSRYFVEFGVENGLECNSTFLLVQGWSGTWIEGSAEHVDSIRQTFSDPIDSNRLKVVNAFVTAETIEDVLRSAGVPEEPDLLCVDIDGNDYWVWKAIQSFRPRVVEIEYNGMFPPQARWVMAYNAEHIWAENSYQGASLRSLAELGESKGYRLVGCSLAGINAYFIREDLMDDSFIRSASVESHFQRPRLFLTLDKPGHTRAFGTAKIDSGLA